MNKTEKQRLHKIMRLAKKKYKRVPTDAELGRNMRTTKKKGKEYLQALIASGHVRKHKNVYKYHRVSLRRSKGAESVEREDIALLDQRSVQILRYVILFGGIGSVVMSIFHSQDWMTTYYIDPLAVFSALVIVSFEVAGFDMGMVMLQSKRYGFAFALFTVSVLAFTLSVWSTVGGMYRDNAEQLNAVKQLDKETTEQTETSDRAWSLLVSRRENAQTLLDDSNSLISEYTKQLPTIEEGTQSYKNVVWYRRKAEEKRDEYILKLDLIAKDEAEWIAEQKTVEVRELREPNFYEWVGGGVFENVKAELFQFWTSVIPALFWDILAPLAFAVFIFTGKRRGEKDGTTE